MVGRPEKGRLVARKLTDYTLGLYAARGYLAAHPAPARAGRPRRATASSATSRT